jgi:hypothetical protein
MINSDKCFVYCHLRKDIRTPFYIGMGKDVRRPWHMEKRSKSHKSVVSRHGVDVNIIVKNLNWENACWWEIRWIKALKDAGYIIVNGTKGGDGLVNPTEEIRKKISESQKKRFQNPEQKKILSERFKGRIPYNKGKTADELGLKKWNHSPEVIEKMKTIAKERGVSQKCRDANKKALTGRKRAPFSAETIERMKIAALKREAAKRDREALK